MKKMNFPRITLPCIAVGSCLLNNVLLFLSMLGIFTLLGHPLSWSMLWLIPLTVLTVMLAVAIGLILGVLNVFVRDIGQAFPIFLQVCFWLTPIVYPLNIIPESYRHFLALNPMYPVVSAYQKILVYGQVPPIKGLDMICVAAFFLLIFSLFLFRRASAEIVDVL